MRKIVSAALVVGLAVVSPVNAGDIDDQPCTAPEHRQFDFWIGAWNVTTPDGTQAGTNRIESILGGCVLMENWSGAQGGRGHSFNMYDQRNGTWHQTWVDATGLLLKLDGGLQDGAMVLSGSLLGWDGIKRRHRITWTPNADGTVRQQWQQSEDGEAWEDVFDGRYAKAAP